MSRIKRSWTRNWNRISSRRNLRCSYVPTDCAQRTRTCFVDTCPRDRAQIGHAAPRHVPCPLLLPFGALRRSPLQRRRPAAPPARCCRRELPSAPCRPGALAALAHGRRGQRRPRPQARAAGCQPGIAGQTRIEVWASHAPYRGKLLAMAGSPAMVRAVDAVLTARPELDASSLTVRWRRRRHWRTSAACKRPWAAPTAIVPGRPEPWP
jgi:hypothetical protein